MAQLRLAVLGAVVLVALAGCSGGPGEEPPIQTTSTPAAISDGAVSNLNLEQVESRSSWLNTSVQASLSGDVELSTDRDVRARTASRVYRSSDSPPVVVAVHSVPGAPLFGDTADVVKNPAASLSTADLVTRAQSIYSVESLQAETGESVTLLGNQTTVQRLRGSATIEGESIQVAGRLATVRHRGDYVTVVVLYPEDGSAPDVAAVLAAVTHQKNGTA